jgi:hypothetical protein
MTVRTASAIFLNSEIGMPTSPKPTFVGISSVLDDVLDRWRQGADRPAGAGHRWRESL